MLGAFPFDGDIYALTFSVNGRVLLAAGGEEGASARAVLWDIRSGKKIGDYGRGYDTLLAADISPDHRMIALGGPDKIVRVYATETGEQLYEVRDHTDWIYSIRFSPDGELLATGDRAGNLLLWQAANGRPVEPLRGHNGAIHALAYTLDSNILASAGGDGQVFLWDTWKYRKIRNFRAHSGAVLSVDISREGSVLTSGRDGLIRRWGLNGKEQSRIGSVGDWVYQAAFTSDGTRAVAGLWNGEAPIWGIDGAKELARLNTNPAAAAPNVVIAAASNTNAAR